MTKLYKKQGLILYTAIPFLYYTGVYRIMGAKNFAREIGFGFLLEIIFTLVLLFL